MENAIPFVLKVAASAASIVGLIVFYTLTKKILDAGGAGGRALSGKLSSAGDNVRKKAQDFADYNKNIRKSAALSGGKTFGGGRFRRQYRRELRNQAAEAAVKSGQAQFGVSDTAASGYTQSIAQSNAQVSAINSANSARLTQGVATGATSVSAGMNPLVASDSEVSKALNAQQERAIADAIKDVELNATFRPGDVTSIANAMEAAIKSGNSIEARAYQNMLMRAGGPGTEAYRNAMKNIDDPSLTGSAAGAMVDVKRNMLVNHGGVKETAADLVAHAADQGPRDAAGNIIGPPRSMQEVSSSKATWANMANEDLVKQKSHSLKQAYDAGGISATKAREIQRDEQLYRKLDDKGRQIIDNAANKVSQVDIDIAHQQAINENTRRSGTP